MKKETNIKGESKMEKVYSQMAKIRDENNVPYLISCISTDSDERVLERGKSFYVSPMVTVESRRNVCEVFWSENLKRFVTIPD